MTVRLFLERVLALALLMALALALGIFAVTRDFQVLAIVFLLGGMLMALVA